MTKSFLLVLFYCERKLSKSRTFIQHFLEIDFDVSASILLGEENSGQTNKYSYSVIHNSIAPIKELCSKMTLGEVGVSLP